MRKIDLAMLMQRDWYNVAKAQVLLHALANLKGEKYVPVLFGINPPVLNPQAIAIASAYGSEFIPTGDCATFAISVQDLASSLITRGDLSETDLNNEVLSLMASVYSDPGYISAMGPFL